MIGVVRRILRDKAFGFIRSAEGGDYFFHASDCWTSFDEMGEGKKVQFQPTKTKKGLRAVEVEAVDGGHVE